MATFNFYLRDKNANSETPIILFVHYKKSRFKIPTEKTIEPKNWNESDQKARLVKEYPQAKVLNQILGYIKATAENCYLKLENDPDRTNTGNELKEAISKMLQSEQEPEAKPADKPTFLELFAKFIQESATGERLSITGNRLSPLSIKKYRTTETRLKEFGKKYHLDFDTIDQNFYKKFLQFLNSREYKPNTIGKYITVVKTYMKYATENGYNTNTHFQKRTFKAFAHTGFSIYLTDNEIEDVYSLDLSTNQRLEPVRDLFLVGCYTGLRYSDFSRLNQSHIEDGFFRIKTMKTQQTVIIPVHPIIEAIMIKNNGLPKAISNQKTNQYLKEITVLVPSLQTVIEVEQVEGGQKVHKKIPKWQLVSTHTARRSFATNLYKKGKMTAFDIMQITGHKTEQAFLKYIKVTPEESAKKLQAVWKDSFLKVG